MRRHRSIPASSLLAWPTSGTGATDGEITTNAVDEGRAAGGERSVGTMPAPGPGARTAWYPVKAAFRAGQATGPQWDDANVGVASVAVGRSTLASGECSTAMGHFATATGIGSTAMGNGTTAIGFGSTAMGSSTMAIGSESTALGFGTTASGEGALAGGAAAMAGGRNALAFGENVRAIGNASVALGTGAEATKSGSFVFADTSSSETFAASRNEFRVRAAGGVEFLSNAAATHGVRLAASGSQWLTPSDARTRHGVRELDGDGLLATIAAMPVTEWSDQAQNAAIRHIGPSAQDFHAAFGLGEDPLRIGTVDADGVALAGVRALEARSRQQAGELSALEAEIARLRDLVTTLTASR